MSDLYIGLMSGTSLDGADVALVEFDADTCQILACHTTPFPDQLTSRLRTLSETPVTSLEELGTLDVALGKYFAASACELLAGSGYGRDDIVAVGYSGHTLFHKPTGPDPFTLQIGDPNVIAAETGIDTVADFRRADVARGGQGAPLVPTFHDWKFSTADEVRVVLNLGGVANISVLDPQRSVTGFDTGPANSLLDRWTRECWNERFDHEGRRARTGEVDSGLLAEFLADSYFECEPPKSTGFEHFNLAWVQDRLRAGFEGIRETDVLTTLTELTAISASDAILSAAENCRRVILCGGGTYNTFLVERLAHHLPGVIVESSAGYGIDPEWVEAVAFAWLSRKRIHKEPSNAPAVTGAHQTALLGGLYCATGET